MVENITLKNVTTGVNLELDMVTTPNFILDNVDWGVISSTKSTFKYFNQIGIYVVRTMLETRDVAITGWIVAPSMFGIEEHKKLLNRFVNPLQPIDILYKDYRLQFLPNNTIRYANTIYDNNDAMCRFVIDGLSVSPLFEDSSESSNLIANVQGMFHFPLIFSNDPNPPGGVVFGVRDPSVVAVLNNKGAVETGIRIIFKANGAVTNPILTNVITQEYFRINKTLQFGEIVEINTDVGSKSIIGTINNQTSNYFRYRDLNSAWLQLAVGDNTFIHSAQSGLSNLEVFIYFTNKYLEVQ